MEVRARVRRRRRRRERRMPELSKKSEDSYSTVREDTHPRIRTWRCRVERRERKGRHTGRCKSRELGGR